jgi:hypothetical protein
MWVRGAAIRPVPRYAVVGAATLEQIERELADDSQRAREELDGAFARFEATQPHLADAISQLLSKPLDETALALGYFLSIAIWLAFERTFGEARLREVSPDSLEATDQAIELEEELRAAQGNAPLDLDDVVSIEQPNVLAFVHEHVDAAVDPSAEVAPSAHATPSAQAAPGAEAVRSAEPTPGAEVVQKGPGREVDAQDVHSVYRATVLLTLCLSHAVLPVDGASRGGAELMA